MYALLRRFAGNSIRTNQLRCYSSFTPRDVVRDTADEAGTLLTRFAKHIALVRYQDKENVRDVPTTVRYADYFPITDGRYFQRSVEKTDASQLPALIILASSYRSNAALPMYATALNTLDAHAVAQLAKMDTSTVLETLYSFLFLIPNWLKRTDFHQEAVRRLAKEDFRDNKERFLQVCFYMGLQKKQTISNDFQALLEEQLPKHLSALTELDLALISNAAYKTSTVITGSVKEAYDTTLANAVLGLKITPENSALLISLIKALRLQRVRDERVCQHLQQICLDSTQITQIEPRGLGHIFAFFAEQRWDQEECMAVVVERLMTLKPGDLRAKDLATLLWSSAQLNCQLSAAQLRQLELAALQKLDHGEYNFYPDNLIDTCLSLYTLGHYSKDLIDAAEELKATQRHQKAQPKVDSRLTVLRSAVAIEHPSLAKLKTEQVFKEFTRAPGYLLRDRTDFTKYAEQLGLDAEIEGVDLVCPISGINIPSLRVQTTGDQASVYFVELLTPEQTLKFSKKPTSLVRLKQRLLDSLGQKVVLLHSGNMATTAKQLHALLQPAVESIEDTEVVQGLSN
ncbi:uncharacterized protein LOC111072565 [Drosophila obscura]|uniref:uncharacterized protein LOC111072565 n=1 Tax=Drosophila obscura TaxID=7282 RepID=UPI000BA0AFE3|nr:uncharacterized protein LOC111072565 [Drosophila obscura]